MRFAHANNLLDITPRSATIIVTVPKGWCGSIQHDPAKIERAVSRYCTQLAEVGLTLTPKVQHG